MAKFKLRFPKKADVPAALRDYFTPVDENDPEGEQLLTEVEPDPKGYAVADVAKITTENQRLKRDHKRASDGLQKFRKPDSEDLYTQEEILAMVQRIAEAEANKGKHVDADTIRKQVAKELGDQHAAALGATKKDADRFAKREQRVSEAHRREQLENAAQRALLSMPVKPKKGLEVVALRTLLENLAAEEIDIEDQELGTMKKYSPRVRGTDPSGGFRLDGKGAPLSVEAFAAGDFARDYASMFEAPDNRRGTPIADSSQRGGGGGGGGQNGSGRFKVTLGELQGNAGLLQERVKQCPKDDMVQILNNDGTLNAVRPGLA